MSRGRELLKKQFVEGFLPPQEDRELQGLLRDSPGLRDEYTRWVELEQGLLGQDGSSAQLDRLIRRGAPPPREVVFDEGKTGPGWTRVVVGLVAAAAVVGVVVRGYDVGGLGQTGPQARGPASISTEAWITVYRDSGSGLIRVEDQISVGDGLAFAYSCSRSSSARYLVIVGRDAAGRVHWFHPAYESAEQRPTSVLIQPGSADRELGAKVMVELAPGPLELCGLFSAEPIEVATVDPVLEAGGPWPEAVTRDCRTVTVVP